MRADGTDAVLTQAAPGPDNTTETGLTASPETSPGTGPETGLATRLTIGAQDPHPSVIRARLLGHWLGLIRASRRRGSTIRALWSAVRDDIITHIARHRWVPDGYTGWLLWAGYAYYALALPVLAAGAATYAVFRRPLLGGPTLIAAAIAALAAWH